MMTSLPERAAVRAVDGEFAQDDTHDEMTIRKHRASSCRHERGGSLSWRDAFGPSCFRKQDAGRGLRGGLWGRLEIAAKLLRLLSLWWRGLDLNQRRRAPTDLQSVPFSHSGTPPRRVTASIANCRRCQRTAAAINASVSSAVGTLP